MPRRMSSIVEGVKHMRNGIGLACGVLLLSACTTTGTGEPVATANVRPASGSQVSGTVKFTQVASRVRVDAQFSSLTPGLHGFHIHEKGDCSAPDAMSSGGHFNPFAKKHGPPDSPSSHSGDMGNLNADASDRARQCRRSENRSHRKCRRPHCVRRDLGLGRRVIAASCSGRASSNTAVHFRRWRRAARL